MIHILQKIADWVIEHETKDAQDCSIPDEIIDEWLDTIDNKLNALKARGKTDTEHYLMLKDLHQKVSHIKEIRGKKCSIEG